MLEGFVCEKITVDEMVIDIALAGEGYPVVLLHGFPETKIAWYKVVQRLTPHFKVIMPDLPGYGDSVGSSPDYSKRTLGNILIQAIKQLDIEQFSLAGHDRGGRVAYRMALDHPEKISSLALLEIIPTYQVVKGLTYRKSSSDGKLVLSFATQTFS
jgi:haloacetate dehalogenase